MVTAISLPNCGAWYKLACSLEGYSEGGPYSVIHVGEDKYWDREDFLIKSADLGHEKARKEL